MTTKLNREQRSYVASWNAGGMETRAPREAMIRLGERKGSKGRKN